MKPYHLLITVATAGVPVRVSADVLLRAFSIHFKPLAANSGAKMYLGIASDFGKATGVNLITDISTAGNFSQTATDASARLHPADYWIDADTSGDKLVVTYWSS